MEEADRLGHEGTLLPVNLDDEIEQSGIGSSDILELRLHSAGLCSIQDMPLIWANRISKQTPFGPGFRGYSLGLSNGLDAYEAVSRAFSLAKWDWGFTKHGLAYKSDVQTYRARMLGLRGFDTSRPVDNIIETTQKYLEIITGEGVPICFFVPRNFASHPVANVTKAELEWYIGNALRASNTYFIFGLYSSINTSWYKDCGLNYEERADAIAQALRELSI